MHQKQENGMNNKHVESAPKEVMLTLVFEQDAPLAHQQGLLKMRELFQKINVVRHL